MRPTKLPVRPPSALSSDGTRNAPGCGPQRSDARSSPERRGSISVAPDAGQADPKRDAPARFEKSWLWPPLFCQGGHVESISKRPQVE
jgi:hypothetical protein